MAFIFLYLYVFTPGPRLFRLLFYTKYLCAHLLCQSAIVSSEFDFGCQCLVWLSGVALWKCWVVVPLSILFLFLFCLVKRGRTTIACTGANAERSSIVDFRTISAVVLVQPGTFILVTCYDTLVMGMLVVLVANMVLFLGRCQWRFLIWRPMWSWIRS